MIDVKCIVESEGCLIEYSWVGFVKGILVLDLFIFVFLRCNLILVLMKFLFI